MECYGAGVPEPLRAFSQVATHLAICGNTSISKVLANLYGRLSHSLIRANAHAILTRSYSHLVQQVDGLYVLYCVWLCMHICIVGTMSFIRPEASKLISKLEDVTTAAPILCGSFCKLDYLARTTPRVQTFEAIQQLNADVKQYVFLNTSYVSDSAHNIRHSSISISKSGLDLLSLSQNTCAALIASFSSLRFAMLVSIDCSFHVQIHLY